MRIYTYAIIDSNAEIPTHITGLEKSCVYNIPYHDIGVVASTFHEDISKITQKHILVHEEVAEKLMVAYTVLPMRLSTVFHAKKDILRMMEIYYSDFNANLSRLYYKVELGIKVIWPGDQIKKRIINGFRSSGVSVPVSGDSLSKKFIREKFEQYKISKRFEKEAEKRIAGIDQAFTGLAAEKKLKKLQTKNLLLNASYLVDKEKQSDFKKAFDHLSRTHGDFQYMFSGPWPPYHFITLTTKDKI